MASLVFLQPVCCGIAINRLGETEVVFQSLMAAKVTFYYLISIAKVPTGNFALL